MRKLYLLWLFLLAIGVGIQAQELTEMVTDLTAGGLKIKLGDKIKTITHLIIQSGSLDENDFKTMREEMTVLSVLDLSGAKLPSGSVEVNKDNVIPSGALCNMSSLVEVIFPSTIEYILSEAFSNCNNLAKIDFTKASNLKEIYTRAFFQCSSLKELDFSKCTSLQSLGGFESCLGLESVSLKDCGSLETISVSAFADCVALESVYLSGCGVKSIEKEAFRYCMALSNFNFKELSNLEKLGSKSFRNTNLSGTVSFPSSLKILEEDTYVYSDGVFDYNEMVKIFDFTNCSDLTMIPNNTFSNCRNLVEVNFTGCTSLRSLSENAFSNCNLLEDIIINNDYYFNLNGALCQKQTNRIVYFPSGKHVETYEIPSSVTTIGERAFYDTSIINFLIPSSVKSIGGMAFKGVFNGINRNLIVTVMSPNPIGLIESIGLNNCLLYVPKGTSAAYKRAPVWRDCIVVEKEASRAVVDLEFAGTLKTKLQEQEKNLREITDIKISGFLNGDDLNAIEQMIALRKMDLGASVLSPNQKPTYMPLTYLEELILPESLSYIGTGFLGNCSRLQKVYLPSFLRDIPEGAFKGCPITGDLTISASTIGTRAFESAQPSSIRLRALKVVELGVDAFKSVNKQTCVLKVPKGLGNQYKSNSKWSGFSEIQEFGVKIATKSNNNYGSVAGEGAYEKGETAILNAYCNEYSWHLGYLFDGWYDGDKRLTGETKYSFAVGDAEKTFDAKFVKIEFRIEDNGYGVEKIPTNNASKELKVKLVKQDQYSNGTFIGWFDGDEKLSDTEEVLIQAGTSDRVITAKFASDQLIIGYDNSVVTLDDNLKVDNQKVIFHAGRLTVNGTKAWKVKEFSYYFDGSSMLVNSPVSSEKISVGDGLYPSRWYFVSFPYNLKVSDIAVNTSSSSPQFVIRKYDGAKRASGIGESWQQLGNNDELKANQGYIFRCNEYAHFSFDSSIGMNALFQKEGVSVSLNSYSAASPANANWNLVGNPYPCYYNISQLFKDGLKAVVTVWSEELNNYEYYSRDDDETGYLPPLTAFFVQKVDEASVNFKPEGRVVSLPTTTVTTHSLRSDVGRTVVNLVLANDSLSDRTRIVLNEEASLKYDLGKDVAKFRSMNANVPMLYSMDDENNQLAINERPVDKGVVRLGCSIGVKGQYTIHLKESVNKDLYLIDTKTKAVCKLSDGGYVFDAENGEDLNRFELRIVNNPTSNEMIEADMKIVVRNGKLFVLNAPTGALISVVDATGKTLIADQNESLDIALPQTGVYYVVLTASNGERTVRAIKY